MKIYFCPPQGIYKLKRCSPRVLVNFMDNLVFTKEFSYVASTSSLPELNTYKTNF